MQTLTDLRLALKAKPAPEPIPEEPVNDPDPVEVEAAPTKKYVKKTKKKED